MKKAILYTIAGTGFSFALQYLLYNSPYIYLDLYYAFAFGLAWGMAYYLDSGAISLFKKLGISLLAMGLLVLIGSLAFGLELAIPSILKFSMVFVAYYVIASFRNSKSLRK